MLNSNIEILLSALMRFSHDYENSVPVPWYADLGQHSWPSQPKETLPPVFFLRLRLTGKAA